jgi:hypothetical protein
MTTPVAPNDDINDVIAKLRARFDDPSAGPSKDELTKEYEAKLAEVEDAEKTHVQIEELEQLLARRVASLRKELADLDKQLKGRNKSKGSSILARFLD